jgi:eukaryotic-like serine/threonine-protein kinase
VLGSYLDMGGQIRVNFRVQDASGETIATASEQGTQSQFFDLIKRVGGTLRESCGARELTPQELEATRASEPTNTEAARYYAEGVTKLRQFDALAARDSLQLAIKNDPQHALAHSALAAAWSQLGYDQTAVDESKKAFDLSAKLPRGEKLSIEARYYENSADWEKAVEIYRSLWTFFPDDLDYGLRLASAQVSAGKGQNALDTVRTLRQLPPPSRDDPRIDLAEATAAESLSDFKHDLAATARAHEKATRQGSRFLVAQALLQQCWAQRNLGELEPAKAAGEAASVILSAANDRRGEAGSLTCVANVLADQGKMLDAKSKHQQALALARKIGAQKDIAGALINLGNISVQNNLKESTASYHEALAIANAVGDKVDALTAQNNIAANLMIEADFPAATKTLLDAQHTADEIGDQAGKVLAQINLGTTYLNLGNLGESRRHLEEALSKSRQLNLRSSVAAALVVMGDLAVTEDALASAEQDYQQSLTIRTGIGEKAGIANSWLSLSALDIEKKDLVSAIDRARRATEEFHNEHNDDQEAMARNILARGLLAQGNTAGAQDEYDKISKLAVQDRSVQLSLSTTGARLLGRSGKTEAAAHQLNGVVDRAQQSKLPAYEFEARLSLAELESNSVSARTDLQRLEKESTSRGFKLVARKARALLKTPTQ